MNLESMIWLSVKEFHRLTRWPINAIIESCRAESLISELVFGERKKREWRISIKSLPLPLQALKQHVSSKIAAAEQLNSVLIQARKHLNAVYYAAMRPYQKQAVDKWLPIMIKIECLNGKKLEHWGKENNVSYSTLCRMRKKWIESGGDLRSLQSKYGNRFDQHSKKTAIDNGNYCA